MLRCVAVLAALAALPYCLILAQSGLSPRQVSPEIVRQMKREAATGISAAQADEFRKLRNADVDLLRRIQAVERKRAELERYVGSLDISVDTRLLIAAVEDIKELKRAQRAAEEEAKAERESAREMMSTIKSGFLMLILGAIVNKIVALWQARRDKQARTRQHGNVMDAIGGVKADAKAAYSEANSVNAKIESLGVQIRNAPPGSGE